MKRDWCRARGKAMRDGESEHEEVYYETQERGIGVKMGAKKRKRRGKERNRETKVGEYEGK